MKIKIHEIYDKIHIYDKISQTIRCMRSVVDRKSHLEISLRSED